MFIKRNSDLFVDAEIKHQYHTRKKCDYNIEYTKYSFIQRNVGVSIRKIWNNISEASRGLNTDLLKIKLKNFLLSKAYYNLNDFFEGGIIELL